MTHGETLDDSVVPPRIRVVVAVALAVPQLVIGIWGIARPMHWFTNFPGIGPRLIAAEPPFNAHLATDTGAGFLATGVALTFAVALGRRQEAG